MLQPIKTIKIKIRDFDNFEFCVSLIIPYFKKIESCLSNGFHF